MLAMLGNPQEVIGRVMGLAVGTLVKHYGDDMRDARPILVGNVAKNLYAKAIKGDTASMIFFLKTQGGWREKDTAPTVQPIINVNTIAPSPPMSQPDASPAPPLVPDDEPNA